MEFLALIAAWGPPEEIKWLHSAGQNFVGLMKMFKWDVQGQPILWSAQNPVDRFLDDALHTFVTLSCYSDPRPGHWVTYPVV